MMNRFSFCAEWLPDVVSFLTLLTGKYRISDFHMKRDIEYPECYVEMEAELSMEDCRAVMMQMPNSDVMLETLVQVDQLGVSGRFQAKSIAIIASAREIAVSCMISRNLPMYKCTWISSPEECAGRHFEEYHIADTAGLPIEAIVQAVQERTAG